jgi:hypothetical protein
MYFNNNNHSKYIIINLKVLDIDYKFSFSQFNNLLLDWIDESLLKKYNNELNWNIGIIYPSEFSLTTCNISNNFYSLENKIVKIFLYLDNLIYPSFNEHKLIYTNQYKLDNHDFVLNNTNIYGIKINNTNTKLNNIMININKLITSFDINSELLTLSNPKFIYSMSISGISKDIMIHEINMIKLENKFINSNYINDFIYLKKIYNLGKHYLINCNNAFDNFYKNLLYNT